MASQQSRKIKKELWSFEDVEGSKWAGWILFGFESLCSANSSALRCQNCLKSLPLLYPASTDI